MCVGVSDTWTSSCSSLLTSSSPPMSSQLTWGTSATVSLRAEGLLWLSAHWGNTQWHQRDTQLCMYSMCGVLGGLEYINCSRNQNTGRKSSKTWENMQTNTDTSSSQTIYQTIISAIKYHHSWNRYIPLRNPLISKMLLYSHYHLSTITALEYSYSVAMYSVTAYAYLLGSHPWWLPVSWADRHQWTRPPGLWGSSSCGWFAAPPQSTEPPHQHQHDRGSLWQSRMEFQLFSSAAIDRDTIWWQWYL